MKETFAVLNQMVADGAIENYSVAGAIGAMFYVESFSTQDIDVFVLTPEDSLIIELPGLNYLKSHGYTEFRNEGIVVEGGLSSLCRLLLTSSAKRILTPTFRTSRRFQSGSFWLNTWLR